jgi:hypothetical protein
MGFGTGLGISMIELLAGLGLVGIRGWRIGGEIGVRGTLRMKYRKVKLEGDLGACSENFLGVYLRRGKEGRREKDVKNFWNDASNSGPITSFLSSTPYLFLIFQNGSLERIKLPLQTRKAPQ